MEKNKMAKIWQIDILAILVTIAGGILVGIVMRSIPRTDDAMPLAIIWIIIIWPIWLFGVKWNRPKDCIVIPDLAYLLVSGLSPIIGLAL